jgi:hypothetical protein
MRTGNKEYQYSIKKCLNKYLEHVKRMPGNRMSKLMYDINRKEEDAGDEKNSPRA